ncbi:hypothetical protein RHGRI_038718 [Rhododendron griersonianum]|uniref:PB1 domain-containing protein n=1 Tax=Rhododendron griersonianum TaxID=479676 RepID=A0AAV6HML4_9ERIC|nr:hypothetical protein RHGRI_038718 [Rhododendron griersonianum]
MEQGGWWWWRWRWSGEDGMEWEWRWCWSGGGGGVMVGWQWSDGGVVVAMSGGGGVVVMQWWRCGGGGDDGDVVVVVAVWPCMVVDWSGGVMVVVVVVKWCIHFSSSLSFPLVHKYFFSFLQTVSRPPDQHEERNTSTTCETPSHNAQTRMEGELFGQNEVANVFRLDFMGGPIALNTESGLIMGIVKMAFYLWRPPDQLEGQTMQFTAHPNPNALGLPQLQIAASQVPSANEDRRNSIASQVEAFLMGCASGSSNLAFPTYSDAAAPSQPVATILTERQDTRSVKVKATYGDSIIKSQLPLTSGIKELMQEVSKTLDCELGSFNVDYKDEDGDWILMARDDNVSEYLQLLTSLGNQATKLKVRDKVPNTTNICETCGSLKQQRP